MNCKKYGINVTGCSRRPDLMGDCTDCEAARKIIALQVDKEKWISLVRELREEYNIEKGGKRDETSARRIAILLGEAYITNFREVSNVVLNVPIVEKDGFDLAMKHRLMCDPLERESRVKPEAKKKVLYTWGVDKRSGMEDFTTQLKEWTATTFLEVLQTGKEENDGRIGITGNGDGGGVIEGAEVEAERTEIFESRERHALRYDEQDKASVP